MSNALVEKVLAEEGDLLPAAADAIVEAMKHKSEFPGFPDDKWDRDTIADICYDIGEEIYEQEGMSGLKSVYYELRRRMGPVAARYLEHFWDGVGDGAWRG